MSKIAGIAISTVTVAGLSFAASTVPVEMAEAQRTAAIGSLAAVTQAQLAPIHDVGLFGTSLDELMNYEAVGTQLVLDGNTVSYHVNSTRDHYVALAQVSDTELAVVSDTLPPTSCADFAGCLALATSDVELIAAIPEWRTF